MPSIFDRGNSRGPGTGSPEDEARDTSPENVEGIKPLTSRISDEKGTSQQKALWEALTQGTGNVSALARAGCGKSSSAREGMWRVMEAYPGTSIRYTVFNKQNADEFRGMCPPGVDVGTMHSFGFRACRVAFRSQVEKLKSYLVMDQLPSGATLQRYIRKSLAMLVGLAKNHALTWDAPGIDASLRQLALHFDVRDYGWSDRFYDLSKSILRRSAEWQAVVDFDDMIWLPVVHQLQHEPCGMLYVDEAQDLNATQHRLIEDMTRTPGCRTCIIGDDRQAIYAFRGADQDSFGRLERMLGEDPGTCYNCDGEGGVSAAGTTYRCGICKGEGFLSRLSRMPLTLTFRCPQSHVALANRLVPDLQAHGSNPEGEIENLELDDLLEGVRPGDMVLSPTNAALISAALALIIRGKPCFVRGRGIGDQLVTLHHQQGQHATIGQYTLALQRWEGKELDRLADLDGVEDVIESVQDRCAGLRAIAQGCDNPANIPSRISALFSDDGVSGNKVCFSSIHRAKGLEAERVWKLLVPFGPSFRKDQRGRSIQPKAWEIRQAENLEYVGLTRSKRWLGLVRIPEGL